MKELIHLSKSSSLLKDIKLALKHNKNDELFYFEDFNTLELCIKFNIEITRFFYVNDTNYREETLKVIEKVINIANEVYTLSNKTFQTICSKDNSIGFIVEAKISKPLLDDFKTKNFILVADSIELPGNLGTIYRTIDSIQADGIILVDSVTKYNNPKLIQASRGTNLLIPTITLEYKETINWLIENKYDIYLGEPELGKSYQEYDYSGKIAIVVGNERFGINKDWYNHKSKKVFIPMIGNNNSLNVGVAASIILYEAFMKRNKKQN